MLIALFPYYNTTKNKTVGLIALCVISLLIVNSSPLAHAHSQNNNKESKSHTIYIIGCPMKGWSCFIPCQTTVVKGDTVTWINRDTVDHMIISGSGQRGPDGWFSSHVISQQKTFSHVFDRKGAFAYYDNTNTYSQGVVIVDSSLNSDFVKLQKSYFSDWWCTK